MIGEEIFLKTWKGLLLFTIVSSFVGFFTLNSLIILIIVWFLSKKISFQPIQKLPAIVWGIGTLCVFLGAFPVLWSHPPFEVSADPFHTIFVRILQQNDSIPITLQPYANYPLAYPLGFHILAVHFTKIIPLPDYHVTWLLGLFFIFSIPLFLYHLFHSMGAKLFPTISGIVLIIGAPIFFFNQYAGLYPALLACIFGLWSFSSTVNRENNYAIPLMAAWLVHPGVAAYLTLFIVTYIIWKKRTNELLIKLPYLLLLTPLLPLAGGYLNENSQTIIQRFFPIQIEVIIIAMKYILRQIGSVIASIFIISILFFWKNRMVNSAFLFFKGHALLGIAIIIAMIFIDIPAVFQSGFYHKIVEYTSLSMIGAIVFSSFFEKKYPILTSKVLIVLLLLLGVTVNLTDVKLNYFREPGEKISLEAARFSEEFYLFDPSVKSVFYFTEYGSKMSEYANKSPFDFSQDYFVPPYAFPADENKETSSRPLFVANQTWRNIMDTNCGKCVNDLNVTYVVVPWGWNITTKKPLLRAHGYELFSTPI